MSYTGRLLETVANFPEEANAKDAMAALCLAAVTIIIKFADGSEQAVSWAKVLADGINNAIDKGYNLKRM